MSHRWPVVLLLFIVTAHTEANPIRNRPVLARTSRKLAGQVLDYTHNHGSDNRIWSPALCEKRDMYVYLPPGYSDQKRYPLVFWLHGFAQDEVSFLKHVIPLLDDAIVCGKLPPLIIAVPDGTLKGYACTFTNVASFFLNTKAGAYEDYLMRDVWDFVHERFPILPERDAHVIAGVSMGAGSAFNKAFKYRDRFKTVLGIFPPLNTRYENGQGRYRAPFEPDNWKLRTDFTHWHEPIARFNHIFTIRLGTIMRPLYGRDPNTAELVAAENPLELMIERDIKDGEFGMFIAYGGLDEFNIHAQVDSFLQVAKQRGLTITTVFDPKGHHDRRTALSFFPAVVDWLEQQLIQYKTP